jgi:polyisoprenoid-binding protein YceI
MKKAMRALPLLAMSMLLAANSARAASDTYNVDAMHSIPTFTIRHLNLSSFRGRFDKVSGTVTLDTEQHSGSADISIDIGSVSTGVPMLDNFLKGPRFFDSTKFPQATFKSGSFKFSGDKPVSVAGELTLHGVTKPVVLDLTFFDCHMHQLLKVPSCGADATATIKRSEFGLDIFVGNDSDEVKLDITIEATKAP